MTTRAEVVPAFEAGRRRLWIPFALTLALLSFALVPPARGNPSITWSLLGAAGGLWTWQAALWVLGRRRERPFPVEFHPVQAHWVQACVQSVILLYWAWHVERVVAEFPLILSQIAFFYALDALLSWSRDRTWRLGFGPLPIVISTNLLLWFHHEWYFLQYLMLTTGALGKQFITWERDGRRTHIFNPSAFGQCVFAIFLIATGTTNALTAGQEISITFEAPHMLLVIFLMGLIVQHLFQVTLMTVAAVLALALLNLAYTWITGVYYFVNLNIAAPIFLGVHLLLTDPATSPRSYVGRAMFGALYGCAYFFLYRILDVYGVPAFWDKVLPVPILNLCVPLIDRVARAGTLGALSARWERGSGTRRMNLLHMAAWSAVMAAFVATGFVGSRDHPGNSVTFWKRAYDEGKPYAGPSLVRLLRAHAEGGGSGAAYNELGLMHMTGYVLEQDPARAAQHFATACGLRDAHGCANVAIQYLFRREMRSEADLALALELLEGDCDAGGGGHAQGCFLVGHAYETGRGRPQDRRRARELYLRSASSGNAYAVKGLARIALEAQDARADLTGVAAALSQLAAAGDPEAMWYLAYMHLAGIGATRSEAQGLSLLQRACRLGYADACRALQEPQLPPFARPLMSVPGWSTAYPLEGT